MLEFEWSYYYYVQGLLSLQKYCMQSLYLCTLKCKRHPLVQIKLGEINKSRFCSLHIVSWRCVKRCSLWFIGFTFVSPKSKNETMTTSWYFAHIIFEKKSKKPAYYKICIKIQVDISPYCFTRYKQNIKDWGWW